MHFHNSYTRYVWDKVENVPCPERFTDDFSSDRGYFTEENNTQSWQIADGVLKTHAVGDDVNVTYIHVFETNVSFKARVRYMNAGAEGRFAFLLRYNSEEAFVRANYHTARQSFQFDYREGADLLPLCTSHAKHPLEAGRWYDIEFLLEHNVGTVLVDGETVFRAENLDHLSAGRIGFAVRQMDFEVDSVDITLLSGQGTVWRDVVHNKLPDNKYREGGTVLEMKDGTLLYLHFGGDCFKSADNGATWERCENIIPTVMRTQVLRLTDGRLIKIDRTDTEYEGKYYITAFLSDDDGVTWTRGGNITKSPYGWDTKAEAGNMNDKISQLSDGRIFYAQNYEAPADAMLHNCTVSGQFFYSDDFGATWTKSDTDSWDIPGNETCMRFGESKILECADGSLRIYNSWNEFDVMVYTESRDRGKTWGPIVKMPEFICARSTMQFCRDLYADNDTTYYMVWCYSPAIGHMLNQSRQRLSLARTFDGKNWEFLGDVWRWDTPYINGAFMAHIVDDFIMTTKDYVICGSGFSEQQATEYVNGNIFHHAQRQHIYSIKKSSLTLTEMKGMRYGKGVPLERWNERYDTEK